MHIITKKRLEEFAQFHPDCRSALEGWHHLVKHNTFQSLVDLRRYFPSADVVGKLIVFNIGGNKARLITSIHFNRNKLYIRHVLTHEEYNQGKWKE